MKTATVTNAATPDLSKSFADSAMPITWKEGHPVPDLATIKTRPQATWAAGDYGQIGVRLQIVGESLVEAVDLRATEKVLDVAAGNGNASLAAARRFAEVTSTDYVPALIEQGRLRAEADRLPMTFKEADAEALPFADGSFDVILSTFGVMFAPDQEKVASELLRVVRRGGRIGLASWTPQGFIGDLFNVMCAYAPPPSGVRSPMEWGSEPRIVELFGPHARDIRSTRKMYTFRYKSAEHWIEIFRTFYGPVHKAFASLDAARQEALHDALLKFLGRWDRGNGSGLVIPGEYLEAVVMK